MSWLDFLRKDPVPWLLDPINPSVRFLTLQKIFKRSEEGLLKEQDRLLNWEPVRKLMDHWDRFNFWGRNDNPYFGGLAGNFGTLYMFSQLGVSFFPELGDVCEHLLNRGRREDGRFSIEPSAGAPWLCYTGIALQTLAHFGYLNDLRMRSAWASLVQALLLRPELLQCPMIVGGKCLSGMVKALAALLSMPSELRSKDDRESIDFVCDYLLNYSYDFDGRDADLLLLTFPRYYDTDLLEICYMLAQTPYRRHHRFQKFLERLLSLQNEDGRLNKLRTTPVLLEERIYRPSRWLTFEMVHILMMTYGDSIYAS